MITQVIEDTRNKIDKNTHIREYFKNQNVELIRTKMLVGDFTLPTNQTICIDLKKDIQELIGDLTSQHVRFKAELELAKKCNIKLIILIQDEKVTCINDLYSWYNWRLKKSPKATKGSTLAKMLTTIQSNTEDYSCEFLFAKKSECGAKIIELLSQK